MVLRPPDGHARDGNPALWAEWHLSGAQYRGPIQVRELLLSYVSLCVLYYAHKYYRSFVLAYVCEGRVLQEFIQTMTRPELTGNILFWDYDFFGHRSLHCALGVHLERSPELVFDNLRKLIVCLLRWNSQSALLSGLFECCWHFFCRNSMPPDRASLPAN